MNAAITADNIDMVLLVFLLFLIMVNLLFNIFLPPAICVVNGIRFDLSASASSKIVLT